MKKRMFKETIMINPQSIYDIDDIRSTLQEREVSILVNMSRAKGRLCKELVNASIDYILSGARCYMKIKVKKIFPKVFVCHSKRLRV